MEPLRPLAPTLIGRGTLSSPRDMLRALETIDTVRYSYTVDGSEMHSGEAALVKLMADSESSTLIVNGCLFLNVASFRYLDFVQDEEGMWRFLLHGDGTDLEMVALPEPADEEERERNRPHLLSEESAVGLDVLLALDDDEEDE